MERFKTKFNLCGQKLKRINLFSNSLKSGQRKNNSIINYFFLASALSFLSFSSSALAEGSRTLYPSNATVFRANLEWRNNTYGPLAPVNNSLLRRTLLQVYAKQGEYILLGSSAVGISQGDILVYGSKIGRIGNETLSDLKFRCSTQRNQTGNLNQGRITSRNIELAGPDTITDAANATPGLAVQYNATPGYVPCYYEAPSDGIYYVVFYGPTGDNSNIDGSPTAELDLNSSNNFNDLQRTSVAAWDVTVRSSLTSTIDINGRLFADYLAMYTGGNARPVNFLTYVVTRDGYRYQTNLNGLDPNGFVIYGNDVGYYDSDGQTPLYRNVLGNNAQLTILEGGTNLALPNHVIFISNPQSSTGASDAIIARNIPLLPTLPRIENASFQGTAGANNSNLNTGGTFRFTTNVPGSYEIIISRDGNNFDPANPQNRVLRAIITSSGQQTVPWNGKDNNGDFFPVGRNYQVRLSVRNGEYHFPLIDAENSTNGGPSFTLLNATNPLGNTTGFYDDRGYRTLSGVNVGTPGQVLCGGSPPSIPNSNLITGFNTTSTQRAFGTNSGGNTNASCSGSFGDAKGLDIWTYVPSEAALTNLNIIASNNPNVLLVKRITGINNQTQNPGGDNLAAYKDENTNPYDDNTITIINPNPPTEPADTDKWPDPNTFLIGGTRGGKVNPGDEIEYTIYFLSAGDSTASKVLICDRIPENVSFIPTAFNGSGSPTQVTGGIPGADLGIAWLYNGNLQSLTNVRDGDAAQYFPPGTDPKSFYPNVNCGGANTNGAVVVNLSDLPNATAPATPPGSYGFVRFRGRVK